jgi:hypothetical protein
MSDLMVALSQQGPLRFATVMVRLVQAFMLRETNGKEICVDLAKVGRIGGNRKPRDADMIKLRGPAKGLRLARGMRPALTQLSQLGEKSEQHQRRHSGSFHYTALVGRRVMFSGAVIRGGFCGGRSSLSWRARSFWSAVSSV